MAFGYKVRDYAKASGKKRVISLVGLPNAGKKTIIGRLAQESLKPVINWFRGEKP